MKKNLFIFTFLLGAFSLSAQAQKQEKTITVEVQNNWNQAKADAPVVINLHELHAGFKVKSAVVMEGTKEIPSQLDDLNRDRKMDELVFVTDLPAHGRKTFQVTLSSEKSAKTYPERVYADMFIVDNRKGKHQRVQAITVPGTSNIYSVRTVRFWNRSWWAIVFISMRNRHRIFTASSTKDWRSKNRSSTRRMNS